MPEMSLKEAIRKVLKEATEPLYYKVISDIIASEGLKQNMVATANSSVAGTLSTMIRDGEPIDRLGDGYYAWRHPRSTSSTADAAGEDDADNATVSIAAYGLYWERDKVKWDVGRRSGGLLGRQNRAATTVDLLSNKVFTCYTIYRL